MTPHDVDGATTMRHLDDVARLSGLPREMYLAEIERSHGREYRLAVAREDIRRRNEPADTEGQGF